MRKLFIIIVLGSLLGCGTEPELTSIINDMVVLTNFDETVDYTQYTTYRMPLDTIGFVSNTSSQNYLTGNYPNLITSTLAKNLGQTNRTTVAAGQPADIGVNIYVVRDLSVYATSYPAYYNPYYGYYGYGGGLGYSYTQLNYDTQAVLIIEFVDLKRAGNIIIWSATIGDIMKSYDPSKKTEEAIDQAFVQSPFLAR